MTPPGAISRIWALVWGEPAAFCPTFVVEAAGVFGQAEIECSGFHPADAANAPGCVRSPFRTGS